MPPPSLATELFAHADSFSAHPFSPPDRSSDGVPSVMMLHESGVDPSASASLGLVANMSEIMLSRFRSSDKLSGCYVATADGCLLFVNDRAGSYFDERGEVFDFPVRTRPWYLQAAEAGEVIFTGVELDAYTDTPTLECAAPVYRNGELAAVVGADIFLNSIQDYVEQTSTEGGFLCVVSKNGRVLFSPFREGTFRTARSEEAQDLRANENAALASFITKALYGATGLATVTVDGTEYYMTGAPMDNVGWTVVSAVEKELTYQPAATMLERYDEINAEALTAYRTDAAHSRQTFIVLTGLLILLGVAAALIVAGRIVKPVEHMTRRIKALGASDSVFEMEKVYRTGDEIEVLAESFASLSEKTRDYIRQITEITAEKERIGTELALATRIQADMLPNIFPAFPERPDFDIYASMDPAKEVGGDFYDFTFVGRDRLGLVIADVSGKGIPAALFMMHSKTALRGLAETGLTLTEVFERVNAELCKGNDAGMFVTVWMGVINLRTGTMQCVNAGHEYPTIRHGDGGYEIFKEKHSLPLGTMEGLKFKEYEITLAPGDSVFVYTDGVPEANNRQGEQYGTERMLAALNANLDKSMQELLPAVKADLDSFVGTADQFDDITMLGFRYNGFPEKRSA
jgi:sigma-B regulation protein RsbU (phosphoserine phosphatase)